MDLEILNQLVSLAKAEFGEAEFAYTKKHIIWQHPKRRNAKGSHFIPIGDGTPIAKEEFDANIEENKRIRLEAFMGRWQRPYWDYYKKLAKPGWREKLVELIGSYPDSAEESPSGREP